MSLFRLESIPPFYHKYLQQVPELVLFEALDRHTEEGQEYLAGLAPDKWDYRYAEGKWTIKEVVQHLIDTERIFQYRAVCFARGEGQALPGFDEEAYAINSHAGRRTSGALMEEWRTVQVSTRQLFGSFHPDAMARKGTANGNSIYVEAIGGIIVGHARHHLQVLRERY